MAGVRSRWLSLPDDLLLRVLAFLDEQELMTARLVCREWRKASLIYMTHLNLNAWLQFTGAEAATVSREALAKCWQVLPNLSNLTYQIQSPDEASLLDFPSCVSALKRLHIGEFRDDNRSVGAVAHAMAPIARLTGLTAVSASFPLDFFRDAPAQHAQFVLSSGVVLTHCTMLCKVVLHIFEDEEWLLLLPFLAGLPHLQVLGNLPLFNEEIVARVGSMTQLTFVRGIDDESEGLDLQPLLRLPALRALELDVEHAGNWPTLVRATTQGMVQLAHLAIHGDYVEGNSLEAVLAPLSGLTRLEIFGLAFFDLPHYLLQASLGNLQDFRWSNADVSGGGLALPLSLRHLELGLGHWDGPEMPGLLQCVVALTRLTALALSVVYPKYGWTTDSGFNATWRAATFLTGLTRLIHLELDHFLHVGNVEGDVERLAVLTGLRGLSLRGSCSCHGGDDHLYSSEYLSEEEKVNWRCGFEAFEIEGGFLRLLPLARLKQVEASGPWRVLKDSRFAAEINAVRHVAGRPPLKFGNLTVFGSGPEWEGCGS